MAAETAAEHNCQVTVYDAMPSVGRKFLVAGKSGLNLTFNSDLDTFINQYQGNDLPSELWRTIITDFDNNALRQWAHKLGIETFVASSGKVFPSPINGTIRAAPLLRRWIERLRKQGIIFKTRHRLLDFQQQNEVIELNFTNSTAQHNAVILALGGGSWPSTGSNGTWLDILTRHGIQTTSLEPANCGWEVDWPHAILQESEGMPMKNIRLHTAGTSKPGELVITHYGLEGAPIYRLGPHLRAMSSPEITIDFKPELTHEQLVTRIGPVKRNYVREAKRKWKLDPATCSLLKHLPNRGPWRSTEQLAHEVKNCHIPLTRPRPLDEAISSAGGVNWNELTDELMLKRLPKVYVAGEMLNWEAPTGGYLLQGCFASGRWVGKHVSSLTP